jgi:hypothetical protein
MGCWLLTIKLVEEASDDHLDLSDPKGTHIRLTWRYKAPKYQGDFHVYIWQHYRQPPGFQYADILLLSPTKVLISCKSSQMLEDFAFLRLDGSNIGIPSEPRHPWSTTSELLLSVLTVYKQMIKETATFTQEASGEINVMVCCWNQSYKQSRVRLIFNLIRNSRVAVILLQARSATC